MRHRVLPKLSRKGCAKSASGEPIGKQKGTVIVIGKEGKRIKKNTTFKGGGQQTIVIGGQELLGW